jgi:NADH:ubiquinone oxidoreductase subunit H
VWAVVPFDEGMYVANLDISLLYVLAIGNKDAIISYFFSNNNWHT